MLGCVILYHRLMTHDQPPLVCLVFSYCILKKTLAIKKYGECPLKKDLAKKNLAIPMIIVPKFLPSKLLTTIGQGQGLSSSV